MVHLICTQRARFAIYHGGRRAMRSAMSWLSVADDVAYSVQRVARAGVCDFALR